MANKAPLDTGLQGTLQRGKACLRCRKRKMRCDGTKPACQQCSRAKKGDACEYDDGKGKTRTQLLRETIVRLEQRIRELEDPEYVSPSVTLYHPHAYVHGHSRSGSSSSSFGSPGDTSLSASHSPFPSESPSSPNSSWCNLQGVPSPSPSPFMPEIFFDEHQTQFQPPLELAQILLDIFSPHRHQCGLDIHMGRVLDTLALPLEKQRHPVLMNAIYLWACFISRPEPLCQHEEHYLSLTLDALRDALRVGDKIIDVIQGSCLLSMYFLSNGRILEGSYHATSAAALAVQYGLHVNIPCEEQSWPSDPQETFDLKPSKTGVQEGERILAFWQVYNLDRCWSVILRKPSVIPDGSDPRHSINCPWPQDMAEYEAGHIDTNVPFQTIRGFLDGEMSSSGFSIQALRAKASALFSRADELSASWDPRIKTSRITEDVKMLEATIAQFTTALVPISQLDALMPEDRHTMIVVHTLVHTASIQLYRPFVRDDPVLFEQCSQAARACVSAIKHIMDQDFNFLDPIIGPCWSYAADSLITELETRTSQWPLLDNSDVRTQLTTLLYAMTTLSARFPIVAVAASKFQKRLAEL